MASLGEEGLQGVRREIGSGWVCREADTDWNLMADWVRRDARQECMGRRGW